MTLHQDILKKEARDWLVYLNSDQVEEELREEFESWCATSAAHAAAYAAVEGTWNRISLLTELAGLEPLEEPTFLSGILDRFLPRPLWPVAASVAALIVVFIVFSTNGSGVASEHFETVTAQTQDVLLADGSKINIGARSALDVQYGPKSRHVTLTTGEAFFSITPDPARPFFVKVGDMTVRVVGTKFNVHQGPEEISVTVVEGIVEILPASGTSPHRLTAGEGLVANINSKTAQVQKNINSGEWQRGRLVYVDKRLVEVIADANRYYDKKIELASAEIADIRITAVFRTDQIEAMIENLTSAYSIQVLKNNNKIILRKTVR